MAVSSAHSVLAGKESEAVVMDPNLHIPDKPTTEEAEEIVKALPEMRCVFEGTAPIIIARIKPELPLGDLDQTLRGLLGIGEDWTIITGPTLD